MSNVTTLKNTECKFRLSVSLKLIHSLVLFLYYKIRLVFIKLSHAFMPFQMFHPHYCFLRVPFVFCKLPAFSCTKNDFLLCVFSTFYNEFNLPDCIKCSYICQKVNTAFYETFRELFRFNCDLTSLCKVELFICEL